MTNSAKSTHRADSTTIKDSLTIAGVLIVVVLAYFVYQMSKATDQHTHNEEAFHPEMGGGNMDQAMASLGNLPKDYETLVQMGNTFMDDKNFAVAAEVYKRALTIKEDANVRADFGACLNSMGLPSRAIEEFQKVLAADPTHATAILNIGIVYYSQQQVDSARVYFEKYLQVEPDGPAAATTRTYLKELGG